MRLSCLITLFALGVACGGKTEGDPERVSADNVTNLDAGHFVRTTQNGQYIVDVQFKPAIPKMGELFSVYATVKDRAGEPVEAGVVVLDARMPQHDHGMETDPIADKGTCEGDVCSHPGGVFFSEGFKFHMAGSWTVTVDVQGPRGPDSTSFAYEML